MKGALHEWLVDEDVGYHGIMQGSVQAHADKNQTKITTFFNKLRLPLVHAFYVF
jgi:hypothetical protein